MSDPEATTVEIEIRIVWDAEAQVYIATSEQVPGLVAQALSLEALGRKLDLLVPEMLELTRDTER